MYTLSLFLSLFLSGSQSSSDPFPPHPPFLSSLLFLVPPFVDVPGYSLHCYYPHTNSCGPVAGLGLVQAE